MPCKFITFVYEVSSTWLPLLRLLDSSGPLGCGTLVVATFSKRFPFQIGEVAPPRWQGELYYMVAAVSWCPCQPALRTGVY